MTELPSGTLTFLFTDIEGSTRLLQVLGDRYPGVLAEHDAIIRAAVAAQGGHAFGSEGDAQHLVFADAGSAIRAAVSAQRDLAGHQWPQGGSVRVRMGMHTGEGRRMGDSYVGLALHETARIAAAGHGGQVLLSAATRELGRDALPDGVTLSDLGEHRLKDLAQPARIFQLTIADLPAEFPPLRTLEATGARLPTQVTSFVGRAEVEAVARLMGTARLVTLTGPGGTGKTRLSIEVAQEVAPRFRDGTFFVALDAISDPELVASEVTSVLGLVGGSNPPLDRLVAYLRERSVLLVLDNLEQVIEAGAIVARLLRDCPDVSVIATSRIPLRIYGEQEFPVPALSIPPPGAVVGAADAVAYESVRLFVERAMAARPDFMLTEGNASTVADIVTRLDGLPLAIELAAARLRMLPVESLRGRLDSRLGVLTGGPRDRPTRQQTLRGAIEWSHDLLDEPDRRLFARFSVVAGGAAFDQVEVVCGPAEELGRDVFDGLQSLTEQSLLRVALTEDPDPRYAMLATIREYAAERLDADVEGEVVRRRHADAYLGLAEEAAPHLLGADGAAWNDRLEADHDNLRTALDWIVRTDQGELGLRMIAALWRFWQVRGHLHEADERIHAILALPSVPEQPAVLRARAESAAGGVAYWRSRPEATHRHYAAALAFAREAGDKALLAEALYNAGFAPTPDTLDPLGRMKAGRPFLEESLQVYRELDDKAGIAGNLWAMSMATAADGDMAGALVLARESLAISQELGNPFLTGWAAHMVGLGELVTGELDQAALHFGESLDIWSAAGDQSGIVLLLLDIAMLAGSRGRRQQRWILAGASDRLRRLTGTEIVMEDAEFIGWDTRRTPENDEERLWFAEGEASSLEDAIELARGELPAR